jgi:hypothetical protein
VTMAARVFGGRPAAGQLHRVSMVSRARGRPSSSSHERSPRAGSAGCTTRGPGSARPPAGRGPAAHGDPNASGRGIGVCTRWRGPRAARRGSRRGRAPPPEPGPPPAPDRSAPARQVRGRYRGACPPSRSHLRHRRRHLSRRTPRRPRPGRAATRRRSDDIGMGFPRAVGWQWTWAEAGSAAPGAA